MNLLQNKTVCLRAPEPEDLELLYSWENNPEWWEIGNTLAPYSRYLLKEYIAESHRGIFDLKQLRLMIDLCSTGKKGFAGFVTYRDMHKELMQLQIRKSIFGQ